MRRRPGLPLLIAVALLAAAQPAAAEPPQRGRSAPPAALADVDGNGLSDSLEALLDRRGPDDAVEVVVTWTGPVDIAAAHAAAGPFAVVREFTIIDGFFARMKPQQVRALSQVPGVFRIEENFEVHATNEEANQDYGTHRARLDTGLDGTGVDVCVVDTGVDPGHEQLDNGKVKGFRDFVNRQSEPYDDQGHGTHVAATAAGDGVGSSPDAARYAGAAPGAGIYAAKVLDSAGNGSLQQVLDGLQWCLEETPALIQSLSLGTAAPSDGLDSLSQAVNNAVAAGKVVVVAAGNSGDAPETVGSPGAAAGALTVGAASKVGPGLHLAPFSSRGPNLAGVLKPEVTSPGVAIVSADAGTSSGYVAFSGSSMATPFVAGTVALALQRDPTLGPAAVKSLVTATARDAGAPGPDNAWGYGLLDGYAVATGGGSIALPAQATIHDSVQSNGLWRHEIAVSGDAVGAPLGVTILIDGELACSFWWFGICLIAEWSPDLDARLIAPDGTVLDSTCPAGIYCGSVGAQETFTVSAAQAGTYVLEIYPWAGTGGAFDVDIFTGSAASEPPPPDNLPPVADAGADQTVIDEADDGFAMVVLDGTGSADPDGVITGWVWTEDDTEIAAGETATVALAVGTHTIVLTVTDDLGATGSDTVVVTVDPAPPPPPPPPDPGVHVGDLDGAAVNLPKGQWQAHVTVTVHDENEVAVSGAEVTFELGTGETVSCTTDGSGTCAVWSAAVKKKVGSVTFSVVSITSSSAYQPAQNHDPDGDSNGTTITVTKP
jgi:serine protease AprX